jgi:alanine-alpha-ketoisovalerate/valine-pyruvate aminotransferase
MITIQSKTRLKRIKDIVSASSFFINAIKQCVVFFLLKLDMSDEAIAQEKEDGYVSFLWLKNIKCTNKMLYTNIFRKVMTFWQCFTQIFKYSIYVQGFFMYVLSMKLY